MTRFPPNPDHRTDRCSFSGPNNCKCCFPNDCLLTEHKIAARGHLMTSSVMTCQKFFNDSSDWGVIPCFWWEPCFEQIFLKACNLFMAHKSRAKRALTTAEVFLSSTFEYWNLVLLSEGSLTWRCKQTMLYQSQIRPSLCWSAKSKHFGLTKHHCWYNSNLHFIRKGHRS